MRHALLAGGSCATAVVLAVACASPTSNACNTDMDCVDPEQCMDGVCALVVDGAADDDTHAPARDPAGDAPHLRDGNGGERASGEGEGDASEGEGDASEGEGDASEGEGDAASEGEGDASEGEGEGEGDATPVATFERWAPGEPNNSSGEDCLALVLPAATNPTAGQWVDRDCDEAFKFICALGDVIVEQPSVCEQVDVGGTLFTICNVAVSWGDADATCRELGGTLARIDSELVSDGLASAAGDVSSSAKRMWIGGDDRAVEGDWRWPDGAAIPMP